jgi:hypothetical protein
MVSFSLKFIYLNSHRRENLWVLAELSLNLRLDLLKLGFFEFCLLLKHFKKFLIGSVFPLGLCKRFWELSHFRSLLEIKLLVLKMNLWEMLEIKRNLSHIFEIKFVKVLKNNSTIVIIKQWLFKRACFIGQRLLRQHCCLPLLPCFFGPIPIRSASDPPPLFPLFLNFTPFTGRYKIIWETF